MKTEKQKKILLIGGAGFIGAWLTSYLIEHGHKVIIIDHVKNYSGIEKVLFKKIINFRKKYLLKGAKLHFIEYKAKGRALVASEKPDIVIHLAAIPIENPKNEIISKKQIHGDVMLTQAIVSDVKKNNIERFIFLSSVFVYGDFQESILTENAPVNPKTPYGLSKTIGEFITKIYLNNWNIIRTTSVYGFGDANLRATQIFILNAIKKKRIWVNSDALLDFVYIKDLVAGIASVAFSKVVKETFHITGGKAKPLETFAKNLKRHFPDLEYEVRSGLNDRPERGSMSNKRAKIMLEWKPRYSLNQGVKEYASYALKFGFG